MAPNDYEVVAYKLLSYLYACMKAEAEPSEAKARELCRVGDGYFGAVVADMERLGYLRGASVDGNGEVVDASGMRVTLAGVTFLDENARMSKVRRFLGEAWPPVLAAAVEVTLAL